MGFSASVGTGLFLLAATYAGCNQMLAVAFFTGGMGLMGFYYSSMRVNALDLAPNYAGTLMAIINGLGAISGMITPYLVGALIEDVSIRFLNGSSELDLIHPQLSFIDIKNMYKRKSQALQLWSLTSFKIWRLKCEFTSFFGVKRLYLHISQKLV